ncbi:PREDICTED: uncharacterized protein LOC109242546 [Nicotiana attenuata]|uniref:Methanol inducible protein n=1 Tax=Nicotiana attenuata TaxID=49451 RepID=A0A314L3J1_NICAT|nr:PREDICTED: uncharacterized protein LOC109242546 [Nicotiana attenuata]OIT36055.1 hypothetical protein A4A49_27797 [Nicotiana attenuata]
MASVQCSKPTQQNNHVQSSTVCNKTCTPTSQKAVCNKTSTPTSQKAVCNKTSTPTSQKANNERHSFTDKMKEMAHKMFHHEHQTQNGQKAHTQQLHQSVCHESCATHGTHAKHSQHSSYHGSTHTTINGRKKMEGHCMPTMQMRKKNKQEKYKFSDSSSSSSSDDSDNEKCGQKKN